MLHPPEMSRLLHRFRWLVALVVLIVGLVIYTVLRRRNRPAKRGGSRARRTGGKGTRRAKDARRAGQNAPEEVGV